MPPPTPPPGFSVDPVSGQAIAKLFGLTDDPMDRKLASALESDPDALFTMDPPIGPAVALIQEIACIGREMLAMSRRSLDADYRDHVEVLEGMRRHGLDDARRRFMRLVLQTAEGIAEGRTVPDAVRHLLWMARDCDDAFARLWDATEQTDCDPAAIQQPSRGRRGSDALQRFTETASTCLADLSRNLQPTYDEGRYIVLAWRLRAASGAGNVGIPGTSARISFAARAFGDPTEEQAAKRFKAAVRVRLAPASATRSRTELARAQRMKRSE